MSDDTKTALLIGFVSSVAAGLFVYAVLKRRDENGRSN